MSGTAGESPSGSLSELTIGTKRIYEGNIINVRVDTVRMPSGRDATREIVEHSHAVCIVPIDNDWAKDLVWLINMYDFGRYCLQSESKLNLI